MKYCVYYGPTSVQFSSNSREAIVSYNIHLKWFHYFTLSCDLRMYLRRVFSFLYGTTNSK